MFQYFFLRYENSPQKVPLGEGQRPTDEELHERLRMLEIFLRYANDYDYAAIHAEIQGIEIALGLRNSRREFTSGGYQYDRTRAECAMDHIYATDFSVRETINAELGNKQ